MKERNIDDGRILEALYEHYKESIFITDGRGDVIFVNRVAAERLSSSRESLMGKNVRDLVKAGIYTESTTLRAIESKAPVAGPINEDEKHISFSNSVPVLSEDGEVEMVVTNNMNLAHQEEWEKIIKEANCARAKLVRELEFLRLKDHRVIIARSPVMAAVLRDVNSIAASDSSVVLIGESGTGKDVMASLIHEKSERHDHAYISINCAAMPESLLESELFGYEGGAFTGAASKGKIGLFEAASPGTIFLDEISEMSLSLQSKLLRVLENRELRRVGGVKNIPVDVRIICATNTDLHELVKSKRFREDLYYRLCVFTLRLPRLKERPEDIVPIAQMFLDELNEKYGKAKVLSERAKSSMLGYAWPGNIRELRNVMERSFVVSEGPEIDFQDSAGALAEGAARRPEYPEFPGSEDLRSYLSRAEDSYIAEVLKACGGSMGKAAARLGIHRSVLYRKLHKAGD